MIIDCISDLHGHYPKLEGGDLLIVAGDLTARRSFNELAFDFLTWLDRQNYKKKILIAGNHDSIIEEMEGDLWGEITTYLCDSGTEFEGLKIWGSPWTKTFEGMNPHCKAFTCETEGELAKKWELIPNDIDILITHGPPHGVRDDVEEYMGGQIECVGSVELIKAIGRIRPKLHVFGHIHQGYGKYERNGTIFVNCSHVNEHYKPVNKPIRIEL